MRQERRRRPVGHAVRRFQRSRPTASARWLPYAAGMALMAWMMHSPAGPSREILAAGLRAARQGALCGHFAPKSKAGGAVTEVLALSSSYAPSGPLIPGSSCSARRRHPDRQVREITLGEGLIAPSTATSMCPPRISEEDRAESKKEAPGRTVTASFRALTRSESTWSSVGYGCPRPSVAHRPLLDRCHPAPRVPPPRRR